MDGADSDQPNDPERKVFLARAYHEAGHAVVGLHVGWPLIVVEAHPLPKGMDWDQDDVNEAFGGGTEFDGGWSEAEFSGVNRASRLRDEIRIALGGPLGQAIHSRVEPIDELKRLDCAHDFNRFAIAAKALGIDTDALCVEAAREMASLQEEVRHRRLEERIVTVAERLLQLQELSGEEVARLVSG